MALVFLGCTGWFISVLIGSEQNMGGAPYRSDAIILFIVFCILIISFLVSPMLSRGVLFGRRIPARIRYITAIGLFLLIPQSTVLCGRLSQVMHSEITLFAMYNMIDVAFGRMMLALIKRDQTQPTRSHEKKGNKYNIQSSVYIPLTRDMIRQHVNEKRAARLSGDESTIDGSCS
jgi:hypothetical protein